MDISTEVCVREVLEVIPIVMRSLRREFRSHRGNDLGIPQYRALMFLQRNPGASLSTVADHLGITPPSTSKLIDGLVERGFIYRQSSEIDRRRINLGLTPAGADLADYSYQEAQTTYIERFSMLPEETLVRITEAMQALRPIFDPDK